MSAGLFTGGREALRRSGVPVREAFAPAGLALAATAAEAGVLSLLVPLTGAAFSGSFEAIREARGFRAAAAVLPGLDGLEGRGLFAALLLLILAAALAKNAFTYAADRLACRFGTRLADGLRRAVFAGLVGRGKSFFDERNAGSLQGLVLNRVEEIELKAVAALEALGLLFLLLAYLAALFWLSWPLALAFAASYPFLHALQRRLVSRIKDSSGAYNEERGRLESHLHNALSSILLMKSVSGEAGAVADFSARSARLAEVEYAIDRRRVLARPAQEALFSLTLLLLLGAAAAAAGSTVLGPRLLVFFYVLRRAATQIGGLTNFLAGAARVSGPLGEVVSFLESCDRPAPDGVRDFPWLASAITFRDARFTYPGGREALRGATFEAPKGKVTALVGASGAGKSTLAHLLLRFYEPEPGSVLLDGVDLREFRRESLRRRMAFVPQEPSLFHDTLRANLVYGLSAAPAEAALRDALGRARLDETVARLPAGLDTVLGDRGVRLSGGERQRLAMARAFLRDPEILILDEATSALDSVTEAAVQESIAELVKGRTALVIAHRLATVRDADRIVVLAEGRVAEAGTREELLAAGGLFRRYWDAQSFA
ncbi:MAG: ABC transporter ATP-binding protein [Elusimicrobiota bacterium]|nr:ABC transporter ATP-binding protein [Elusimicrobiota bacterium]